MAGDPGAAHGAAFALSVAKDVGVSLLFSPSLAWVALPLTQVLLMTCHHLEVPDKIAMLLGPLQIVGGL